MNKTKIIKKLLIVTLSIFATTSFSYAWNTGGNVLTDRKEISGVDFVNANYDINTTRFGGNQGKKGKEYENLGKKGRIYLVKNIRDYKKIKPITVLYPKYLYLKRTNTYYDLILSVLGVYSNKKKMTFILGRKPEIRINDAFQGKNISKKNITSLKITQKIRISKGQKKPRKLGTFTYYFGFANLNRYEAVQIYGDYKDTMLFKPKKLKKSACKYYKENKGYTVSVMSGGTKYTNDKYKVYFKNSIVKNNPEMIVYKYRYGGTRYGGKKQIGLIFSVVQPNLAKEKTNRIINKAIKFANKYALDDKFHYTNYSSEDKKTQKCPVCLPELQKVKKYCGWNCIGYVSAAFYHAGVKTVECRAGGIVNDGFAEYDKLTEKSFQERNGSDWHLILKQNKYLPESKLKKGDVLICYSGKTFKHICIYDGNGYIYDAKSSGDNISKRSYLTIGVTPKIAFRYRIDKLQ